MGEKYKHYRPSPISHMDSPSVLFLSLNHIQLAKHGGSHNQCLIAKKIEEKRVREN